MAYRYIKLRRTIMGKLIKTTLLLACTFMLFAVVDDAQAGRQNKLCQLRQDRLEIGRGMLEVQNVDWTTLLATTLTTSSTIDSIVDVYGIEMLTQFLGRLYGSSPDLVTTIEDETLVATCTRRPGRWSALQRRALRSQGHFDHQIPSLEQGGLLLAGLLHRRRHHEQYPRLR
jgi:hypothetical protein